MEMYNGYLLHQLSFPGFRRELHKKVAPIYGITSRRNCNRKKNRSKKSRRHLKK